MTGSLIPSTAVEDSEGQGLQTLQVRGQIDRITTLSQRFLKRGQYAGLAAKSRQILTVKHNFNKYEKQKLKKAEFLTELILLNHLFRFKLLFI